MNGDIEIPSHWLGKSLDGSLEKILQGKPTTKKAAAKAPAQSCVVQPATNINDPENWLILEGRKHSQYSYPALVVSMHRLGMSPDVEQAARSLGYNLANTATEKDGTGYIGNINWEEAITLNLTLGNIALNPRQGMDLLLDLSDATRKKNPKILYYANGQQIDPQRLKAMYEEIRKVREPWRSEWLDAKFVDSQGMRMLSNHHLVSGQKIAPQYNELVEPCLDDGVTFSMNGINHQGLPTKADSKSKFYFYKPGNDSVAGFYAGSGWASLDCDWDPSNLSSGLGVRAARLKN